MNAAPAPAVLFIVDHLNGGGAENMNIQLSRALLAQDIRVGILLLNDENSRMNTPEGVEKIGLQIPAHLVYGHPLKQKKYPIQLQQQIQQHIDSFSPTLVIISFWNSYWINTFIQAPKIINWLHGDIMDLKKSPHWYQRPRDFFRQKRYQHAFKHLFSHHPLVVVNQDLADRYQPLIAPTPVRVIANGIDQQQLRHGLPQHPDKIWDVVFVGRFSTEKQPDHAIHAFAQSGLSGRLAMVGDGAMKEALIALANDLQIGDRVDFLGWLQKPAEVMQQSRCLILSSRTEGSPLVPAEALTLGVPVVAYRCCSGIAAQLASPALQQGLVEAQNLAQLATTLAKVVNTPYPISPEDQQHLSIEQMAEAFLALLNPESHG